MKRRTFLLLTLFTFFTKAYAKKNNTNELDIIKSTLEHMFPNTIKYNGANKFKAFDYFKFIITHKTFDKEDFDYLIEGAKKLYNFNNTFLISNTKTKEKILRDFEQTNYGQNWLSNIIYYGLEAMLSDPVYKGNKNMSGWKNINHTTPIPTAVKPFGKMI